MIAAEKPQIITAQPLDIKSPEELHHNRKNINIGGNNSSDVTMNRRSDSNLALSTTADVYEKKSAVATRLHYKIEEFFYAIGLIGIALIIYLTITIIIMMGNYGDGWFLPAVEPLFWIYLATFFSVFMCIAIIGGYLVKRCGVDVMYTRKFIHFFSFFLPFGLYQMMSFKKTMTTHSLTFCAMFIAYMPLSENIRSIPALKIFRYAYASFHRDCDEDLTLLWAVTQSFSAFVVLVPCSILLGLVFDASIFIMIPLLTVAIGDGMAEIIGRNFGKHKYRTRAMCTRKRYTRSIEGSLCVFIMAIISISLMFLVNHKPAAAATEVSDSDNGENNINDEYSTGFYNETAAAEKGTHPRHLWNWWQFTLAYLTLPIIMTIAEAKAPHSWDNAILLAAGSANVIAIFALPSLFSLL